MASFSRGGMVRASLNIGPAIALSGASVADSAAIGTTVGVLSTINTTGSYTYSLTSNPGGLFAISGANLNTAAALTAGSYPITVQASGGVPTPISQAFLITATAVVGPNAPVLILTSPPSDSTPEFLIDFDDTVTAGDSVRLQVQISGGSWSSLVSDTTHVITAPEDAADSVNLALAALPDGNYQARASTIDGAITSAWSNTVTFLLGTSPTITSSATDTNTENTVLAHALTANQSVTWSIAGGADAARFEISGSTLRWLSNGTKDFEAPNDADTNNTYVVTVRATNAATLATDQTVTVTVTDVVESGVSVTWVSGKSDTTDLSTYVFTGMALGDFVDVAVAIMGRAATVPTITAVTVHTPNIATDPTGTALTSLVQQGNSGSFTALFSGARPVGQATGDIKAVLSAGAVRCRCEVWKKSAHTGSPVTGSSVANAPTATINVPASGAMVACAYTAGSGTSTPTNMIEDSDGLLEGSQTYTSAHSNSASGSTTFTFTFTAFVNSAGVFAAFGP